MPVYVCICVLGVVYACVCVYAGYMPVYVCVWVCACVCVGGYMPVCVCMCIPMGGSICLCMCMFGMRCTHCSFMLGVFLNHSSPFFLRDFFH